MDKKEKLIIAKELLLKRLTGRITASEEETLQKWIEENDNNRKLAGRVLSKDFLHHAILDANKEKRQHDWQRLAGKAGLYRKQRMRYLLKIAAAAAVLLLCAIPYYYEYVNEPVIKAGSSQAVFHFSGQTVPLEGHIVRFNRLLKEYTETPNEQKDISPDLYARIDVPRGGEYRVVLDDSTRIHLNSGSSLYVAADFSPNARNISLSGEAYLEVHHDEAHPFTIRTEKADIRVLGTTLNIEAYEDDPTTTITLVEGRVKLHTGKEHTELQAGYEASIDEDRHILINRADLYERTGWHNNRIVFNDCPLEEIMRKAQRWYDITPAYSNDRLRNLHITMDIDKRNTFNQFARMIENLNEVSIRITRHKVLISESPNLSTK